MPVLRQLNWNQLCDIWLEIGSHLKIPGYTLATCTESEVHGTATFVKHHAKWITIAVSWELTARMDSDWR